MNVESSVLTQNNLQDLLSSFSPTDLLWIYTKKNSKNTNQVIAVVNFKSGSILNLECSLLTKITSETHWLFCPCRSLMNLQKEFLKVNQEMAVATMNSGSIVNSESSLI